MKKDKAIVLISGGMDSALVAAMAIEAGYDVAALHLNYGQRTEEREQKAFGDICNHYLIKERLIVDVSHLSMIGGSSLTDMRIQVSKANLDSDDIPDSYVPFRNGNILSIAASWAEVINAKYIYIGAMQLDSSGYPDCRREFFDAFEHAIDLGIKPETSLKIITPIIDFSKKDIVELGSSIGVPFHLTWSCYSESVIPCGICDSCALRQRGFDLAGIKDPLL
jgi:7-cyano-7-deazaguanine synthase